MKAESIVPLSDRVLVKPSDKEQVTSSGIFIPQTAQERPKVGEVVKAGSDVLELKVGDIIMYGKYAGTEVEIEGEAEPWLLMREADVFVVVEPKE